MQGIWCSKRDMATIAGGVALGWLGSRLLPPLIASARGSAEARSGRDPFERLIEEHREFVSLLHDMERTPKNATARRAAQFLKLKRSLAKHAMAEEDIVYPLLHDEVGVVQEVRELYDEHGEIKIHLYALERLLKQRADWTDRVRQLRRIIEEHAKQEENVEFPRLRNQLNKKAASRMAGQIRREEALIL